MPATSTGQPKENGPSGVILLPGDEADEAGDEERRVGAPGDELAMREIGEAQDRIGQGHADRAEADHGADEEAVGDELQVHADRLAAREPRRDRARRSPDRSRGRRRCPRAGSRPRAST